MKLKDYKIQILSVIVIALIAFQLKPKNIVNIGVYLEGDKADIATVIDLSLNYNEKNLKLVSYSTEGVLKTANGKRFLVLPNSEDLNKPLVQLKFETNGSIFTLEKITVSPESEVYLSKVGVVNPPSGGVEFKLKYEE